ncbi:MAG: pyruvate kinase [Candidatus Berkelbacteria bacterium]|nr:pyruvate kinase [Candidatus Berkelbacteria bacterium]
MIARFFKPKLPDRRTKIVCTIGPATSKDSTLRKLVKEGMDFARFNFSHGHLSEFEQWAKTIRKFAKAERRKVEIIQDLQGPRVRVGTLAHEGRTIIAGHKVVLVFDAKAELRRGEIPIENDIGLDLKRSDKILMDRGLIELEVKKIEELRVVCRALTSGHIFTGKGVNLPSTESKAALTQKDLEDIKHGLEMRVEWIALSFVEGADDIRELKKHIKDSVKIIAKIERPQAIHNYHDIVEAADAVMIARGDLGIEIPFWKLPVIQKRAIRRARNAGKPSIVATDMLGSMVVAQRPTRAEILDVANAVIDGASAVMLSDETAVGKHPVEALVAMRKIIEEAEDFKRTHELKSLL